MTKIKEKEKAVALRKKGVSISDIAQQVSVTKSTVSYWCRDITLSDTQIAALVKKSRRKGVESFLKIAEQKRKKRVLDTALAYEVGKRRIATLSDRDVYCVGLGLYWGEGYKQGSQEFGFTNADPDMVLFYIRWLKVVFNVRVEDLIFRVSINQQHAVRVSEVLLYWERVVKASSKQFTKTSLIKTQSKKQYTNMSDHFGTLRIKVRKGTQKRREVLGAIEAIKKQT